MAFFRAIWGAAKNSTQDIDSFQECFAKKAQDIPAAWEASLKKARDNEEMTLQKERDELYRKKVIDSFFEYGKLKSIPSQRKKERIVLEEIAKSFEMGREYTEREINIIIADYHDDFCTIRRDMISEGILTRENMMYRKL